MLSTVSLQITWLSDATSIVRLYADGPLTALGFWRNSGRARNGLRWINTGSTTKPTISIGRGAGDKRSFAGSLRHPLMHRGHASFGHIAHFGSMGLQQFYNLGVAGGLDDGHAGFGDSNLGFNILMDVKKRI